MNQLARTGLLFAVAASLASTGALAACSDDDTKTSAPLAIDAGTGNDASRTSEPGNDGSGQPEQPTPELTCEFYCDQITANCTGDNAQYITHDECMTACPVFPKGSLADMQGN